MWDFLCRSDARWKRPESARGAHATSTEVLSKRRSPPGTRPTTWVFASIVLTCQDGTDLALKAPTIGLSLRPGARASPGLPLSVHIFIPPGTGGRWSGGALNQSIVTF